MWIILGFVVLVTLIIVAALGDIDPPDGPNWWID